MTTTHTTDPLSALRGTLYRPHRDTDRKVCALFASAPPELRPVMLDYARGHWSPPWERHALGGSEVPVGWALWGRLRERCELMPGKVCTEKAALYAAAMLTESDRLAEKFINHGGRCEDCTPPLLVWRTPLTQEQWAQARNFWTGFEDNRPLTGLSWWDALGVCNDLSHAFKLPWFYNERARQTQQVAPPVIVTGGPGFRLPTVAQWRHFAGEVPECGVCEGSGRHFSQQTTIPTQCRECGGAGTLLDYVAWHDGNSEGRPHRVGEQDPNEHGLYDCYGNVWEWCWGEVEDGMAPIAGGSFLSRPGEWDGRTDWDMGFEDNAASPVAPVGMRPILPLRTLT